MVKQFNLSINELWSLLTRAFEALYGHQRDYYDMARTALWLECHGHDGVVQLIEALPTLEKQNLPEPNFVKKSPNHIVINGGGHSLFCIGRSIADLAIAEASNYDIAHLEITNVVDSRPLIGVLSYIATQHFSAVIKGKEVQAVISPSEAHPIIYEGQELDGMGLVCSKNMTNLTEELAAGSIVMKDKESQKDRYSSSLDGGVDIQHSHYDRLISVANRVLVESTEESRKGAGE